MATVYSLVCSGGSGGAYFTGLTTDQKSRYGSPGSYRVYAGLVAWNTGRASASAYDTEVCEIGDNFIESTGSDFSVTVPAAAIIITTMVNGTRSAAFHNGNYLSGYIFKRTPSGSNASVTLTKYRTVVDGFTIRVDGVGYNNSGISMQAPLCITRNMFLVGRFDGFGSGVSIGAATCSAYNNVSVGWDRGFNISNYLSGLVIANNLSAKNTTGFYGNTGANILGFYYNNISIGNATNWPTTTGMEGATKNAGLATDTPWVTSGGSSVSLTTADFVNYAGNDFRPALVTSPQVETGIEYYDAYQQDIADDVRPSYIDGVGDAYDVGPYEYDQGFGLAPNVVPVAGSGIVDGTRIKIAKVADGAELRNNVMSGTTSDSFSQDAPADIPVYIYARKGSSTPFYKPLKLSATITDEAGLSYNLSGLQIEDIARGTSYAAGVATDWTFNSGTGAIVHAAGTTRYSAQDLYSWHANYYDDSATVDDNPLINGITPTQFELINSGTITDADLEDLYGGSIEFADGTLWSNLYTVGSLAGAPDIYVYQGATKLTQHWSAGHIDILAKVKNAGALIESGLVTGYARKWGYTYAHYEADLSGGGRNVMPLATLADANITETEATVAGWTDVGFTFGTYSLDFGDGDGSKPYFARLDCANRPLSQANMRAQYVAREGSAATLNGVPGDRYQSAHASMTPVTTAPFGTYSGGVWSVAPGVWLDNVPSGDLYNYIVTDAAGGTHQNVQALFQSVTVSNLTAGSRVQIYDTTNSAELFNDIAATSTVSWDDLAAPAGDRAIRVRITYVSGVTAKTMIEADIGTCGTAAGNKDVSYRASQVNDAVYIDNAVDGSTITNITINDATDLVQIAIPGGTVSWAQIYAYQVYWLNTSTGIQDDFGFMEAIDQANYVLTGFLIKNTSSPIVPLKITGGYGRDAVTGSVEDIFDTSGGSIFPVVDHVVSSVITISGSSVITGDISELPTASDMAAAVLAAAQSTPIHSDMKKVAGSAVNGAGTASDPWRP